MLMMQSAHRDVLEAAIPDNDTSRAHLVEELQSRGRAAVGASSWMDAKLLYEKALTVLASSNSSSSNNNNNINKTKEDANRIAVLNSNLSLVLQHMGSMEEARTVAMVATEADPSYVKGWWRLGQALQKLPRQSSAAVQAFATAIQLEPTNKALVKELEKCQKKALEEEKEIEIEKEEEEAKRLKEAAAEEQMKMDVEDAVPSIKPTTTQTKSTMTTTTNATTPSTPTASNSTTTSTTIKTMDVDHEDDEKIFTKSDNVRGYKIVNGKKTSYFHNELSEEAKNLIGDIAPKKLDSLETAATTTPTASDGIPNNGASAWNKAGTWEEKDLTQWAKTTLQEHLEQAKYVLPDSSPAPGAEVTVSKVTTIDGHASCALARGKKRYIYEFMVKLEWKLERKAEGGGLECSGSLAFPDIDGTIELGEGYEMHQFVVDSVSENSLRPLIERFVQRGGFHESLNNAIDDWVRRFKRDY